jgi:hypothetical protein
VYGRGWQFPDHYFPELTQLEKWAVFVFSWMGTKKAGIMLVEHSRKIEIYWIMFSLNAFTVLVSFVAS